MSKTKDSNSNNVIDLSTEKSKITSIKPRSSQKKFLDRINSILKRSYNAKLEIIGENSLKPADLKLLQKNTAVFTNNEWIYSSLKESSTNKFSFPLIFSIKIEKTLSIEKTASLKSFIECTALPYFLQKNYIKELIATEDNLINYDFIEDNSTELLKNSSSQEKNLKTLSNLPISLEHKEQEIIFKTALEIHESSGRISFLPYTSLSSITRSSLSTISSLKNTTLFIKDISLCSKEEVYTITNYIKSLSEDSTSGPGIIIGFSNLEKATDDKIISTEQLKILTQFHFNLNRRKTSRNDLRLLVQQIISLLNFETTNLPV